jgi:hypothetical protein
MSKEPIQKEWRMANILICFGSGIVFIGTLITLLG